MGYCYLLHFHTPFKHAKHYTGYANTKASMKRRIKHHENGTSGAKLMYHVKLAGITFTVARTWEDVDRSFERKLKNRHGASKYCPICQGKVSLPVK